MTISISLPIAAHAMVVQVRTVAELGGTRRNSAATRRNSHDHGTTTVRPRYDHDSACTLDAKIVRSQSRCCIFPTVVRADADFGTEGQVRELGHHQENKDEYHLRCAAAPWSRRPSHFHLHQRYKRGRQVDTRRPLSSLVTPASALRRCAVGGLTSRALASAPGSSATARAVAGTVVLDGYSWSEPPCRTYRGVSVQGIAPTLVVGSEDNPRAATLHAGRGYSGDFPLFSIWTQVRLFYTFSLPTFLLCNRFRLCGRRLEVRSQPRHHPRGRPSLKLRI